MKTATKTTYICETCGKKSEKQEVIQECEKSHKLISDKCIVEPFFAVGAVVPDSIRITWEDGYTMAFIRRQK